MRGHGPGPKSVKGRMRPARRRKARPRRVRKTKSAETDRRYRRIDPIGGEYNKGRRAHTNLGADKILLNRFRRTRQSGPCTHVRPSRWKMAARNPSTTPAKKDGRLPTERLLTKPRRSERKRRRTGSRFGMIEERSGRYSASAGTRSEHGSSNQTRTAMQTRGRSAKDRPGREPGRQVPNNQAGQRTSRPDRGSEELKPAYAKKGPSRAGDHEEKTRDGTSPPTPESTGVGPVSPRESRE